MKRSTWFLAVCLLFHLSPFSCFAAEKGFTNSIGMKFIFVEPGVFFMGSPQSEPGREADETRHRVEISTGFFISATEVTQGQWKQVMGDNPSAFQDLYPNGPVEQVSWFDCTEFIDRLNAMENTNRYRLPTEGEWEYACRAGTSTAFYSGEISRIDCKITQHLDEVAWYCGNSGHRPHRVALKKPNAWGLYDMHGNVHEWCLDQCDWRDIWSRRVLVITRTYKKNIIDPLSRKGEKRVFRGGGWNQSTQYQRSADRGCFHPVTKRSDIGFRLVKTGM